MGLFKRLSGPVRFCVVVGLILFSYLLVSFIEVVK